MAIELPPRGARRLSCLTIGETTRRRVREGPERHEAWLSLGGQTSASHVEIGLLAVIAYVAWTWQQQRVAAPPL